MAHLRFLQIMEGVPLKFSGVGIAPNADITSTPQNFTSHHSTWRDNLIIP